MRQLFAIVFSCFAMFSLTGCDDELNPFVYNGERGVIRNSTNYALTIEIDHQVVYQCLYPGDVWVSTVRFDGGTRHHFRAYTTDPAVYQSEFHRNIDHESAGVFEGFDCDWFWDIGKSFKG